MERKELGAILDDDFENFLELNDLLDDYLKKKLLCIYCDTPVTLNNIFAIFYDSKFEFCCNSIVCMNQHKLKAKK